MKFFSAFTIGFLILAVPFGLSLRKEESLSYQAEVPLFPTGRVVQFPYYETLFEGLASQAEVTKISEEIDPDRVAQIRLIEKAPHRSLMVIRVDGPDEEITMLLANRIAESFRKTCDDLDREEIVKITSDTAKLNSGNLVAVPVMARGIQIIEPARSAEAIRSGTSLFELALGAGIAGLFGGFLSLGLAGAIARQKQATISKK